MASLGGLHKKALSSLSLSLGPRHQETMFLAAEPIEMPVQNMFRHLVEKRRRDRPICGTPLMLQYAARRGLSTAVARERPTAACNVLSDGDDKIHSIHQQECSSSPSRHAAPCSQHHDNEERQRHQHCHD